MRRALAFIEPALAPARIVNHAIMGCTAEGIECNPRFNGASYSTVVAHKLGLESWVARVFPTRHRTRHRSLTFLQLAGIEYNPYHSEGVVLVNWAPILFCSPRRGPSGSVVRRQACSYADPGSGGKKRKIGIRRV